MSQFYDLASLVVIPSGYKASTIYAQKPLTTDGQLSFTRASTATRVNASGLIEAVSSNVPRLDYLGSSCPRLLLEPQRTNLTQYSEQLNNAYWTKTGSTATANAIVSPDGYTNADLLTESSTNADHAFYDIVSYFVSGTTYTLSFFAKANGRTKVEVVSANSGTCPNGRFDLAAKTATATGTSFGAKIEDYGNGWFRCSVSRVAPNTGLDVPYHAMVQSFGTITYTGDGTSGMYFWGMQTEAGAYATSYIPTLAASVTRVADAASKTGISSLIGQTEGTLFVEFNFNGNYDANGIVAIDVLGAGGNEAYIFITGAGQLRLELYLASVIQASITTSIGAVGRKKIAFAYKANDFVGYMNGVQVGTDTSGTVGAMDTVYVGTYQSATYATGNINQALLFKTRLTNAQLAELTTL